MYSQALPAALGSILLADKQRTDSGLAGTDAKSGGSHEVAGGE